jgi:transcriptional regulator with XRE-family HTH domain
VAMTLRKARRMKDLSQADLAEKLGMSLASYQRYERDLGKMRVEKLDDAASILGVDAAVLLASRHSTDSSQNGEEDGDA